MKRISFKVAKALKKAGYPQYNFGHHYLSNGESAYGALTEKDIASPTYLEVWIWLWREKDRKLLFYPTYKEDSSYIQGLSIPFNKEEYNDPEVAIIAAIEYLVNNNLIK